jgi:hypothetical protein
VSDGAVGDAGASRAKNVRGARMPPQDRSPPLSVFWSTTSNCRRRAAGCACGLGKLSVGQTSLMREGFLGGSVGAERGEKRVKARRGASSPSKNRAIGRRAARSQAAVRAAKRREGQGTLCGAMRRSRRVATAFAPTPGCAHTPWPRPTPRERQRRPTGDRSDAGRAIQWPKRRRSNGAPQNAHRPEGRARLRLLLTRPRLKSAAPAPPGGELASNRPASNIKRPPGARRPL